MNYKNNTVQLFNLKTDPGDQTDLSESQLEMVEKLRAMLHQWRKDVHAKMMASYPDYVPGK